MTVLCACRYCDICDRGRGFSHQLYHHSHRNGIHKKVSSDNSYTFPHNITSETYGTPKSTQSKHLKNYLEENNIEKK